MEGGVVEAGVDAEFGHLDPPRNPAHRGPAESLDGAVLHIGIDLGDVGKLGRRAQRLEERCVDRRYAHMEAGQIRLVDRLRQPQMERAVVVMPGDEVEVLLREQALHVVDRPVLAQLGIGRRGEPEHRRLGQDIAEIGLGAAHQVIGALGGFLGQREGAADRRRAALEIDLHGIPARGVDFLDQRLERTTRRAADREATRRRQSGRRGSGRRRHAHRRGRQSGSTCKSDTLVHLEPPVFVCPLAMPAARRGTLRECHPCCPRAMSGRRLRGRDRPAGPRDPPAMQPPSRTWRCGRFPEHGRNRRSPASRGCPARR